MSGRARSSALLVAFAGLAAFATAHWALLVDPAPGGRLALCVAAATTTGAVLAVIGHSRLAGVRAGVIAAVVATAGLATGLAAVGVAPRLLAPTGWGELASGIDAGLAGLAGEVEYPYRDGFAWSRLAILAVAPVALTAAAAAAFWPFGERGRRRGGLAGLAILVGFYATAAAATSPDEQLLRGAALLVLIGAWLWLPALRLRDALLATALVAAAGAIAVPAAAELRSEDPWLDYRNWTLRNAEGTTYRWEHSYGPIDWPRDGTQMLSVASEEAHYWKTVVLDRFNGTRWIRSEGSSLGARDISATARESLPSGADPRWLREFTVTIGDLETDVVVGAGLPTRVLGIDEVETVPDGTTISPKEPLRSGDAYRVRAYVPDPTAEEMRSAPQGHPRELADYTRIDLPAAPGNGAPAEYVRTGADGVALAAGGVLSGPEAERIAISPYRRVLELTRELVGEQPTNYDAVRAIQDHLRNEYEYSEFPPRRDYPLASFLFEDRRGYCQQFSGAMALMLRMAGIPSRVASGFAPGTRNEAGDRFRVEDFDAHSWVEVYFSGVGWVAFDPTPAAAPISSQQLPGFPTAESESQVPVETTEDDDEEAETPAVPAPGAAGGSGSVDLRALLAASTLLLATLVLATLTVAVRTRRHRRRSPADAAAAQFDELAAAVDRFGWQTSAGATLLELEDRLRRRRHRASARYVERLRAHRFGAAANRPPGLAARRALRRELASSQGLRGRLRALIAIPPGGPRPARRG